MDYSPMGIDPRLTTSDTASVGCISLHLINSYTITIIMYVCNRVVLGSVFFCWGFSFVLVFLKVFIYFNFLLLFFFSQCLIKQCNNEKVMEIRKL